MWRIVRTTTLQSLRADASAAERAAHYRAELATDSAIRAETAVERLLGDLGQAYADRVQAEGERDEARALAETVNELRADLDRLRAEAADTESGASMRGALAYHALRRLYADGLTRGLQPRAPFDLLAIVLDMEEEDGALPQTGPRR